MSFFFAARTQGAAALSLTKPAHAAYGDSANVFGKVSNPTGTYISNLQMRFDFEFAMIRCRCAWRIHS